MSVILNDKAKRHKTHYKMNRYWKLVRKLYPSQGPIEAEFHIESKFYSEKWLENAKQIRATLVADEILKINNSVQISKSLKTRPK